VALQVLFVAPGAPADRVLRSVLCYVTNAARSAEVVESFELGEGERS
jgi:hypothetical protein